MGHPLSWMRENPVLETIRQGHEIPGKIHKLRVYNPKLSNMTIQDKRRDHRAHTIAMSLLGTDVQACGPHEAEAEYAELSLLTLSTGIKKIAINGAKLRFGVDYSRDNTPLDQCPQGKINLLAVFRPRWQLPVISGT